MSNRITRRDWLKLVGGSAIGLAFSPIPWKILDDSAKWTQNWSLTPVPKSGRINYKNTICTICSHGCAVRVRCVDNLPISLSGVTGDPISGGALCAIGLGGHLLRYHPSRLTQACKRVEDHEGMKTVPESEDYVISQIKEAVSDSSRGQGSVAILDCRPGRSISTIYREFLASFKKSYYVVPDQSEVIPLRAIRNGLMNHHTSFGFELSKVNTILSFGTPVLDNWATPAQFKEFTQRRFRNRRDRFQVIQVEPARSLTALLADQWIPIKPGSESALALAISNVIVSERLCDIRGVKSASGDFDNSSGHSFVDLIRQFTIKDVEASTGVPAEKITGVAHELASGRPSLVVFGNNPGSGPFDSAEETIFMNLNILLAAAAEGGAIVPRRELPDPIGETRKRATETRISEIPDNSIKVLIMDGVESSNAIPWSVLKNKLVKDKPLVVSFASYLVGVAQHADYFLPSPIYMETIGESPTPASSLYPCYAISAQVLKTPQKIIHPLAVIQKLSVEINSKNSEELCSYTLAALLKARVQKIHDSHRGKVFDAVTGETKNLQQLENANELMKTLLNGGRWYDDEPLNPETTRYSFGCTELNGYTKLLKSGKRSPIDNRLVLTPYGVRDAQSAGQSHPLMTKLYRESDLREAGNSAQINPATAAGIGAKDGDAIIVTTSQGSCKLRVYLDTSVMPGVIQVVVAPLPESNKQGKRRFGKSILEICKIENDSTWRMTEIENISMA